MRIWRRNTTVHSLKVRRMRGAWRFQQMITTARNSQRGSRNGASCGRQTFQQAVWRTPARRGLVVLMSASLRLLLDKRRIRRRYSIAQYLARYVFGRCGQGQVRVGDCTTIHPSAFRSARIAIELRPLRRFFARVQSSIVRSRRSLGQVSQIQRSGSGRDLWGIRRRL